MGRPSKLTDKQWAEVDTRISSGQSIRSVAKFFGVSESAIRGSGQSRLDGIGGWIYIITADEFQGLCKIGLTGDVARRIDDMQTGCPYRLYALGAYKTHKTAMVESMLHAFFHKKRVRGEWFSLSADDLQYIDDAMNSPEVRDGA